MSDTPEWMKPPSNSDDSSWGSPSPEIDASVPHTARVWNYWLGGKDNFPVDRELGDQIRELLPQVVELARADRAFLARAVTYLVGEVGIRQFLDIGTGLPTANNTHEVAQGIAPESRIVYVDNDPLVLVHARALLTSTPEGVTDYIHADLRDPDAILEAAAATLDLTRPIALTLLGIVEHIPDDDEARAILKRLLDALPSGSYLAIAHDTNVVHGEVSDEAVRQWNESATPSITLRSPEQITRFFDGLELLEPGVVSTALWRLDPTESGTPREVDAFCGLARKP
ncbi:MAG: SAM-dependent methyltransferase [Streptosporangiales bacterium]|nr:SAM-dependent methyltransferase [Streptosporangiales bacterium]